MAVCHFLISAHVSVVSCIWIDENQTPTESALFCVTGYQQYI